MKKVWYSMCLVFAVVATSGDCSATTLQRKTTQNIVLPQGANNKTTIVELTVPPGDWIAISKATVVNFGASDFVRCILEVADPWNQYYIVDNATVMAGKEGGAAFAATIVSQASISKSGPPGIVRLSCSHDTAGISGIYFDPNASLVITDERGPQGPQGPQGQLGPRGSQGPQGPQGSPGPPSHTSAVCIDASGGTNPSSAICTCAGRTVVNQGGSHCRVTSDTNACEASGVVLSGLQYNAACCVCAP